MYSSDVIMKITDAIVKLLYGGYSPMSVKVMDFGIA